MLHGKDVFQLFYILKIEKRIRVRLGKEAQLLSKSFIMVAKRLAPDKRIRITPLLYVNSNLKCSYPTALEAHFNSACHKRLKNRVVIYSASLAQTKRGLEINFAKTCKL